MGLLDRIKAAFSPARYLSSTVRPIEGYGILGAKHRPFNYDLAVSMFYDWAYAAAVLNASAVANVGLRLFTRAGGAGRKLYRTRPVDEITKRYLTGRWDAATQPSRSVLRKVAQFQGEIEEVVEPHPALEVLHQVNPWMNGYELDELLMIDLQLTGNHYQHVVDGELGVPDEIWRMAPQWTKVIPDVETFIKGYAYGRTDAEAKRFAPDEVDHYKLPNPKDPFYGMGWVEAGWSGLGLHKSKRVMDTAKFDNMARPDYLLTVKSGAGPAELDRFTEKVNEELRGVNKAGKFLTLSGDVTATKLNMDVEEIGTATRVIEEISAVSGVPVSMLLTNDPNRANSDTARLGWYRNAIRRYTRLIEEKRNEKWIPRFEGAEDLVLCYDHVCFEDRAALVKEQTALVAGGITLPNEARGRLGYPQLADPAANRLNPPAGNTGAAAAVTGDMNADQNQDRQRD
jgi:HK97 family phage portal protein